MTKTKVKIYGSDMEIRGPAILGFKIDDKIMGFLSLA
jgi:hypothetical protein